MRYVIVAVLLLSAVLTASVAGAVTIAPPIDAVYSVPVGSVGGNIYNILVDDEVVGLWGNTTPGPYGGQVAWITGSFTGGKLAVNYTEFNILYNGEYLTPVELDIPLKSFYVPGHIVWLFQNPTGTVTLLVDIDTATMSVVSACEVPPPDPIGAELAVLYDSDYSDYVVVYSPTINNNGTAIVSYDVNAKSCTSITATVYYDKNIYSDVKVRYGLVDAGGNTYVAVDATDANFHMIAGLYAVDTFYAFNGTGVGGPLVYKGGGKLYGFDGFGIYTLSTTAAESYDVGAIGSSAWTILPSAGRIGLYYIQATSSGLDYKRLDIDVATMSVSMNEYDVYVPRKGTGTTKGLSSIVIEYSPTEVVNATIPFSGYILSAYVKPSNSDSYTAVSLGSIPAEAPNGMSITVSTSVLTDVSSSVTLSVAGEGLPTELYYVSDVGSVTYRVVQGSELAMEILPIVDTYSPTTTIGHFKSLNNEIILPTGLGEVIDPSVLPPTSLAVTKYTVFANTTDVANITELNMSVATVAGKLIVATEPGVHITGMSFDGDTVRIDLDVKGYVIIAAPKSTISSIVVENGSTTQTLCSSTGACDSLCDADGVIVADPGTIYITFASASTGFSMGGEAEENDADLLPIVVAASLAMAWLLLLARRKT